MKSLANTIATLVVSFFITLLLNSLITYITHSGGEIQIGPNFNLQGQTMVSVDLANFKQEPLSGLILSIPISTAVQQILSTSPLQIELLPDNAGIMNRQRIKISGIEPNQMTKIQIPVANASEASFVEAINAKQLNLSIKPVIGIFSPIDAAIQSSLGSALIYIVVYGAVLLYILRRDTEREIDLNNARRKTEEQLRAVIEESDKKFEQSTNVLKDEITRREKQTQIDRQDIDKLNNRISEVNVGFHRQRILLLARLSDYAKELRFWRDTIRKILYQTAGGEKTADIVIGQVTESLRTYSTLHTAADETDFKAIEVVAGLLAESKKRDSDLNEVED